MLKKDLKVYKFSYGNIFKKILCYFLQFMINISIIMLSFAVYAMLTYYLAKNTDNNIFIKILAAILTVIMILTGLFFTCFTFFPRRIVMYDNYIRIQKNAINTFIGESSFSTVIPYSTITSCDMYDREFTYRRCIFIRQRVYPCTFFDWDSLVKITDIFGSKYYIPVKNAEDFIDEVNQRRELLQNT